MPDVNESASLKCENISKANQNKSMNYVCIILSISCKKNISVRLFEVETAQKQVSMTRKYHNHTLQTNPWHREEYSLAQSFAKVVPS